MRLRLGGLVFNYFDTLLKPKIGLASVYNNNQPNVGKNAGTVFA